MSKPRSADEYRQILESNLEEYSRLSRIVESLLFLARTENTEVQLRTTRLHGVDVLEAVCRYHDALAEEKGIRLFCQGRGYLYVYPLINSNSDKIVIFASCCCWGRAGKIAAMQEVPITRWSCGFSDTTRIEFDVLSTYFEKAINMKIIPVLAAAFFLLT